MTTSAHEERGDFVEKPQDFEQCVNGLIRAFADAEPKTKSLVRHLLLVLNPYVENRNYDHFLSMFNAFERVIEAAWKMNSTPSCSCISNNALVSRLQGLIESVRADGGEDADVLIQRLSGFINTVESGVSWTNKLESFLRVYPTLARCSADLWPVKGTDKKRELKEIRNALAHGRGSFVSMDVIAVANWHLGILMERLIFVLLGVVVPEGIRPYSDLLRHGAGGWYEKDFWTPLQSKPDQRI